MKTPIFLPGQNRSARVLGDRGEAAGGVDAGVEQCLVGDVRAALVAGDLGDDGGEVPPRAVAPHTHPRGVPTEARGGRHGPAQRVDAVQGGLRRAMLRRHPVVHADHDRRHGVGDEAAQRVVHPRAAENPSAAVVVDEEGVRAAPGGAVEPHRDQRPVPRLEGGLGDLHVLVQRPGYPGERRPRRREPGPRPADAVQVQSHDGVQRQPVDHRGEEPGTQGEAGHGPSVAPARRGRLQPGGSRPLWRA